MDNWLLLSHVALYARYPALQEPNIIAPHRLIPEYKMFSYGFLAEIDINLLWFSLFSFLRYSLVSRNYVFEL